MDYMHGNIHVMNIPSAVDAYRSTGMFDTDHGLSCAILLQRSIAPGQVRSEQAPFLLYPANKSMADVFADLQATATLLLRAEARCSQPLGGSITNGMHFHREPNDDDRHCRADLEF